MILSSLRFQNEKDELTRVKKRQKAVLKAISKNTHDNLKEFFSTDFPVEDVGQRNCENLVGSVEIPVGLVGPVKVEADDLNEEIILPFATTEGALVASYNRGCKAINEAGGVVAFLHKTGMTRAPVYICKGSREAHAFGNWLDQNEALIKKITQETSNHLTFKDLNWWVRGKYIYVRYVFDTDQAMGMNMVSIALQHLWAKVFSQNKKLKKLGLDMISLSGNVCTDKKESLINRVLGRGYEVQAEILLPGKVVKKYLKTTSQQFFETHLAKNLHGSNLAGSSSQNMHFANGLSAMLLATGQDPAHVVEASQGSTIVNVVGKDLYVAVVVGNLNIGVIGGGTWLPAQHQARKLIRFGKNVSAQQLAIAMGVGVLAGEISGIAALSSNTLACAHQKLARKK